MELPVSEIIVNLRAELLKANGSIATLTGERDALQAQVTPLAERISTLEGQVTTLTTERDSAVSARTALEGTMEQRIRTEVIDRIGSAGAPPVVRVPEPDKENAGAPKTEAPQGSPQSRLAARMVISGK